MSVQNILWKLMNARRGAIVTKAAAATLTLKEVRSGLVVVSTNSAITLPVAAAQYKGAKVDIAFSHASGGTVVVAAGFAGGGAAGDTCTVAQGDYVQCICDGTYWYSLGATVAA